MLHKMYVLLYIVGGWSLWITSRVSVWLSSRWHIPSLVLGYSDLLGLTRNILGTYSVFVYTYPRLKMRLDCEALGHAMRESRAFKGGVVIFCGAWLGR